MRGANDETLDANRGHHALLPTRGDHVGRCRVRVGVVITDTENWRPLDGFKTRKSCEERIEMLIDAYDREPSAE